VVGPALVAAAGLVPIVRQAWAARAWPRLAALAALVAVGVALAVPIRVDKRFERKYYGLGHAWLEQGRLDRAQWALERSLAAEAGFLPSLEALARVHVQTGDTRRARVQIDAWEREARARRDFAALERAARLRRSLEPSG
jgi:Tfp pilus assembly protein PilF